ncbi:hypothetical protein HYH03_002579 [Edaphochlamys debaryana]|uniref:Protein kinase domain-containing protein n=1 Tax=Edaphochlamys debaryana TaxID=47281 RepID=A0A835YJB5_9CHLO|nr:hypothetical protein HYH03_002579 [Edaphochlamys debaryana]|eukprot:KAG2499640.1 hypothetical protein HYH03_002579 [Edaphochlamys debaryana]
MSPFPPGRPLAFGLDNSDPGTPDVACNMRLPATPPSAGLHASSSLPHLPTLLSPFKSSPLRHDSLGQSPAHPSYPNPLSPLATALSPVMRSPSAGGPGSSLASAASQPLDSFRSERDLPRHRDVSDMPTPAPATRAISAASLPDTSSPAAASPPTAAHGSSLSAAVASQPPQAAPGVAPAPAPVPAPPPTTLLALNPALPGPLRRRTWSLEDFNVVKRLYKGSTSSVYKAVDIRSGMPVALKVYFLSKVPRNVVHMVKREIELHHQLVHPNIIQLYAAFLDADRIVLVQEYAARGDLFHLLRQMGGRMSEQQVTELVMRPFLDALSYLHARGICHRDIKPENVLYTERWSLKLADFGVSINLNDERAVTRAGTLDYMAPEVTRCPLKAEPSDNKHDPSLAYTSAVDVWAAGVLTYELLVGFTPVVAPPQHHAAMQTPVGAFMAAQATPKALHFPTSMSAGARTFILGALAEDPGDRPTTKELARHPWLAGAAAAFAQA